MHGFRRHPSLRLALLSVLATLGLTFTAAPILAEPSPIPSAPFHSFMGRNVSPAWPKVKPVRMCRSSSRSGPIPRRWMRSSAPL
jgi:hypothetical protein